MGSVEYGKIRGISDAAVRKAINMGHRLPGVVSRLKIGKVHILTVDEKKLEKFLQVSES